MIDLLIDQNIVDEFHNVQQFNCVVLRPWWQWWWDGNIFFCFVYKKNCDDYISSIINGILPQFIQSINFWPWIQQQPKKTDIHHLYFKHFFIDRIIIECHSVSHIFSVRASHYGRMNEKKRQRLIVIFVIHQHIIFMFANQCSFWLLLILNVFQISQQNEQKNISVCNRESQYSMKLMFVFVRCLYHSPSTQPRKKNSCLFSSYSLHFILIIIIIIMIMINYCCCCF